MNSYTYFDNKQKTWETDKFVSKAIFNCHAESINEADKKFQEAFGKDPSKEKYVSCQIHS